MSFQKRLKRNIEKKEKTIEKERQKIEMLKEKLDAHKINRAEYNIKKKKIGEKIRFMDSRMRVLQGGLTKEKRQQEVNNGGGELGPKYIISFGKWRGKSVGQVLKEEGKDKLNSYCDYIRKQARNKGVEVDGPALEFLQSVAKLG